jgi:hypothetical protein
MYINNLNPGCAQALGQHKNRIQMVSFVQQEELSPLYDGKLTVFGVKADAVEIDIV